MLLQILTSHFLRCFLQSNFNPLSLGKFESQTLALKKKKKKQNLIRQNLGGVSASL